MAQVVKPKLDQQSVSGWMQTGITVWAKLDEKGKYIPGTIWPHDYPPENVEDYYEIQVVA